MSEDVPLIDIRPDHWKIVRDILKKHVPQYEVWAFGSRAKWNAKPYSDLDLAIITDHPLSLEISASLADDFSESDLPWKVDIVDWASTSESFRKVVERDKVIIQEGKVALGMVGEWPMLTIADCASSEPYSTQIGPFGEKIRAENYTPAGAPVLRGTNVNPEGRFHDDDFVFIDPNLAETEFSKFICEAGDVVLCHKGTLGKIGVIPKRSKFNKYIMGNSMMKVRCNQSKLEPLFLYYWLCSRDGQDYIFSRVSQVGVPQIQRPLTTLREAVLPVPPLPEQRAITHILGTLDDKIELNRRRNETLEAMARALFKDWFVDFGPVRAKMEGREPYLPDDIWELFPERLDDGGRPEGWVLQQLSTLFEIIGGGTPKTSVAEYWGGDIPWFSVGDTPPGSDVFVVATEKAITEQGLKDSSVKLMPKGTTIISARGTIGNLAIAGREMTFNQSCYGLRGAENVGDYFVYLAAQQMVDQLKSMAHGSVFSTITRQTFEAIQRPVPPSAILRAFESSVVGWFELILSSVEESRILAQLRDTLLPKLIAGELRVKHARPIAESGT